MEGETVDIFLDTANLDEIKRWLEYGLLDGVTTNPTVMLKDGGYDMEERAREIARLVGPRPVSVEVTTDDPAQMLQQAHRIASWSPNIVVKIPVVTERGQPCLGVVRDLELAGVRVNMTACLSFGQAILGAKAGATYVSIFAGRVADEGHDAAALIREVIDWLGRWGSRTRVIAGSIREAVNIKDAAVAGAHVITVPPAFLEKFVDHRYSRDTVRGFNEDAARALARMEELQAIAVRAGGEARR
ncbi:MAG: transaldolase family protein [Dehalococcoidia bacterium]|nr:transaldolase family protein [Dehalococcoidia bacterium]